MKSIFKSTFYLRSNYVNKEGKNPVMLRIYLNNERLSIGSTGISVLKSLWDIFVYLHILRKEEVIQNKSIITP